MTNVLIHLSQSNKSKTLLQSSSPTFLNVSKKILARQSIFSSVDCNIQHSFRQGRAFLAQEKVKISDIYQKLLQRMDRTKKKQELQKLQHERRIQELQDQINGIKAQIQEDKLETWEVKNQVIELQEVFDEEIKEYNEIWYAIQAQQQSLSEEDKQTDILGSQNSYNEEDQSEDQSGFSRQSHQDSIYQEEHSISKPTCSIKEMISDRQITTPNLSKLEVGSVRALFSQHDSERYDQFHVENRYQQQKTDNKILSFKKSEHFVYANP